MDHFKHKEEDSLCFLTSNHSCSKEQVVQLGRQSSTWWLLDNFQPAITVREFYVAQPDHGAVYEMDVSLLDADRKVIGHFTFRDDVAARSVKAQLRVFNDKLIVAGAFHKESWACVQKVWRRCPILEVLPRGDGGGHGGGLVGAQNVGRLCQD